MKEVEKNMQVKQGDIIQFEFGKLWYEVESVAKVNFKYHGMWNDIETERIERIAIILSKQANGDYKRYEVEI